MKRTFYSIIVLFIILVISGMLYYKNWQTKKDIKKFEESEYIEESLDLREEIKKEETPKSTPKPSTESKNENINVSEVDELKPNTSFNIGIKLTSSPIPVKTHKQSAKVLFLQDEANNLYLYQKNGKKLWARPLGEKLKTEIIPLDIYKNDKIQYLFATKGYLYLIDFNGNRVAKYPTKLKSNSDPDKLSVIDYSNSKNYRIFLSRENGDLYLMDKWSRPLPGWSPKVLESKLVAKAEHFRIAKRDYLVSAHLNGMINLYNRKGEYYSNYPLKIPTGITSFTISKGNTKVNSYLYVISQDGILFQFNVNGKKVNQLILPKNRPNSIYNIIKIVVGSK